MKTLLIGLALMLAQTSLGGAKEKQYGGDLTGAPTIAIEEGLAKPGQFKDKEVIIEGTVGSVCEMKGCWMYVESGDSEIRVDFKDYAFFVPYDSKGKKVRVQGVVYEKLVNVETLKHWAEDAMKEDADAEEITEDKLMVMFKASGVLMEGGSDLSEDQLKAISGKKE